MTQTMTMYAAQTIAPSWGRVEQASTLPQNRVGLSVERDVLQEMVRDAFHSFVAAVRGIPSVEQVRAHVAGTYLHLVTYMSCSTEPERYAVYAAEIAVHDRYPHIQFEFDLIDRKGRPVQYGELTGKFIEIIRDLPDQTDEPALHQV